MLVLLLLGLKSFGAAAAASGAADKSSTGTSNNNGSAGIAIIAGGLSVFLIATLVIYFCLFRGKANATKGATDKKPDTGKDEKSSTSAKGNKGSRVLIKETSKEKLAEVKVEPTKIIDSNGQPGPSPEVGTEAKGVNFQSEHRINIVPDDKDEDDELKSLSKESRIRFTSAPKLMKGNDSPSSGSMLLSKSASPSANNLGSELLYSLGPSKSIPPSQTDLNDPISISNANSGSISMEASQNIGSVNASQNIGSVGASQTILQVNNGELQGPGGTGLTILPAEKKHRKPPTNLSPNRKFRISKVEEWVQQSGSGGATVSIGSESPLAASQNQIANPKSANSPVSGTPAASTTKILEHKENSGDEDNEKNYASDEDMNGSDDEDKDNYGKLVKNNPSSSSKAQMDPETRKSISKVELWLKSTSMQNKGSGGLLGPESAKSAPKPNNTSSSNNKDTTSNNSTASKPAKESETKKDKKPSSANTTSTKKDEKTPATSSTPSKPVKESMEERSSSANNSSKKDEKTPALTATNSSSASGTTTKDDATTSASASKKEGSEKTPLKSAMSQKSVASGGKNVAMSAATNDKASDKTENSEKPDRGALKRRSSVSIPDKHTTVLEYNKEERPMDVMTVKTANSNAVESGEKFEDAHDEEPMFTPKTAPKGSDNDNDDDDDDDGNFPDTQIPNL